MIIEVRELLVDDMNGSYLCLSYHVFSVKIISETLVSSRSLVISDKQNNCITGKEKRNVIQLLPCDMMGS
jgi:hypothetical protein